MSDSISTVTRDSSIELLAASKAHRTTARPRPRHKSHGGLGKGRTAGKPSKSA